MTFEILRFTPEQPYETVLKMQEAAVADVIAGGQEKLIIGQHASVYTLGTSTKEGDVLDTSIPTIKSGRGGRVTWHGEGQIVAYPILDLKTRGRDVKCYVCDLQQWLIATLERFGIEATTDDDVGVWVGNNKIAAIGVRVRRWVTFHGVALNVNPDLAAYKGIVPCGLVGKGVTSMAAVGCDASVEAVERVLVDVFRESFG